MRPRASRDRSPGRPCAHASIRSALIRPSQVSEGGWGDWLPPVAGGSEGVVPPREHLPVSQRLTMSARLVRQPRPPTLSSPEANASSSAAAQAS